MIDTPPERGEPALRFPEAIPLAPFPCHHGCGCRLHEQTVYGSLVEPHEPDRLDNGEMAELVTSGARVAALLNGYRDYLDGLTARVSGAHTRADSAIARLEELARDERLAAGPADIAAVERDFADHTRSELEPPPRLLRWLSLGALAVVAVFDAWFFQQVFSSLLNAGRDDLLRLLGLGVGAVLAIGMYFGARRLAGPVWRLRHHWRTAETGGGGVAALLRRLADGALRTVALLSFPVVLLCVFALWAGIRANNEAAGPDADISAHPWQVIVLLLMLALIVMAGEIDAYHPYQEKIGSARRRMKRIRKEAEQRVAAAESALGRLDADWRTLRSSRDQCLTQARAELGRAWSALILPARLRHGRAGWEPPRVIGFQAPGDAFPDDPDRPPPSAASELTAEDVELLYRFFENVRQPTPGLGPLAEVVRSVRELDPAPLRAALAESRTRLYTRLGAAPPDAAADREARPANEPEPANDAQEER
ncbi:hypothetical protein [Allonocardiopsis opalescens]|uniref:Uncharacterized protein n=1 Tax=Allonocardiopsis opalescens TaxID=1144618 RepID=A0A2T0QA51_9ACTN|nr:hypothetical protein [Allonocardiopsis opalescens]PRY00713.1 hypothetical protein CLV72_102345 [Allonocardiopsis opalescens]